VAPKDSGALAEAIIDALDDPAGRARLGRLAQARARQYSADAAADAYERLFRELVGETAPAPAVDRNEVTPPLDNAPVDPPVGREQESPVLATPPTPRPTRR
jgi:hypothetical protein